ncbi:MAG TPA: heat-shock protein Hsp20 [Syntrophus sp. (in: bacteria)]|jgi:HSP20 family molecular chaperone IbpA|nr:heat-shock protein Hsp20 [Syntrophus sp. (in: bacteria)]
MDNKDMDTQKQPAGNTLETERTKTGKVFVPRVDIYETQDSIVLTADMPGVDEKAVDITLEKNVLTITGSVAVTGFEGHAMAYSEYDVGDFERAFTISDEVDRDKIEATVKNGVLRVILHKAEKVKARKIAITAA